MLGYARDSRHDVASDLYACLQLFYKTFPDQLANDLYITGESYAGHYIPAFGAFIHDQNTNNKSQTAINLKGISIGDGWTDPLHQMGAIPGLMYNLGLTDTAQNLVRVGQ